MRKEKHTETAGKLEEKHLTEHARAKEDESHQKLFLLQVVQPGLAGLWTDRCRLWRRCLQLRMPRTRLGSVS